MCSNEILKRHIQGKITTYGKDVVVRWGSKNIARNNSTAGMKHLLEFVISANHTNAILMSAPNGYDLMSNSCVNNGVETFNRKLHKSLERFGNVERIEVISERNLFTKHGQHMISEGKESMAKKIASAVEFVKKESGAYQWKMVY